MTWMRTAAAAAAVAVAGSLIALPGQAHAVTAADCKDGSLASKFNGTVPVARKPGQKADNFLGFTNTRPHATGPVNMMVVVTPGTVRVGPAPTLWWRVDHGSWHRAAFTFQRGGTRAASEWYISGVNIGSFAAHQKRTVELSWSFSAKAQRTWWWGYVALGTAACQKANLYEQGFSSYTVVYDTSKALTHPHPAQRR
ncbi:hypothetical protein [Streptacidiphilus monticola]|uniref:Uncharacterized protein n=1 Tax=Streptacidiphilus monticola TaxID=2161674 RepID=A0ABW1G3V1_9ACTN